MRLIDADALFPENRVEVFENDGAKTAQKIIERINSAPTIDVKQMAQEIARHCEENTECTDCKFFTGNYERMCMLADDEFCTTPSDWLLLKDGDQHDSC